VADWDENSETLARNLAQIAEGIEREAPRRGTPTLGMARAWHRDALKGLSVPNPAFVGNFRGEAVDLELRTYQVRIGSALGTPPAKVADELREFERRLVAAVTALDERYPVGTELDTDGLLAVTDLAGWAHAEWVRIHPFANGNGRTARLWANYLLVRYGLTPVLRLRPRPQGGYGWASASAMRGDWKPTAELILQWLREL
jgi:hypothetical protein